MSSLPKIGLSTSVHAALVVLMAVMVVAISYWVYRRTVPPIATSWRVLLVSLRGAAMFMMLLLLFEPILSVTHQRQEPPIVAILLDDSASMSLIDDEVDRRAEIHRTLSSPALRLAGKKNLFEYYLFSHTLSDPQATAPDSLELNGDGTDIRRALQELEGTMTERHFAAVILLTDGASNLGENPVRYAKDYRVPIYPIAIGDPSKQKDVLISNFVTNEVAYEGKTVPVEVYVSSNEFSGNRVTVELTHQGKSVDSKTIVLSGTGMEQKVRLHFKPEGAGLTKYEINLPHLEGELTGANNSKSFYTNVLKSKLKLLLLAGGPGPDVSFLTRLFRADEDIEIETMIEKRRGAFYHEKNAGKATFGEFDCYVMLNYPRPESDPGPLSRLRQLFAEGKPALFLWGKNTDLEKLTQLGNILPFSNLVAGRERSIFLKLLPQGAFHPVMRVSEDELENQDSWAELPPIYANLSGIRVRNGASTLAIVDRARTSGNAMPATPVVLTFDSAKRRSAAILAYGLWRWDFLMTGLGKTNEHYQRFMRNTIRWLTTDDDSKLVRITPNKEIYRSGEQVKFVGQVYFEDYQPADGADVAVQLIRGDETQELNMSSIGDGRYEGSFQVLAGGDYQFNATAHQQGRIIGRDSGRFSVEEFSLEFQNTRMNEALLRRIATDSGGQFFQSGDLSGLEDRLNFPEKYITISNQWQLWKQTPILIACLIILGLEWFIRKKRGML